MREETRRLWYNFNDALKRYHQAEYRSYVETVAEREMHKAKREFEEHLNRIDSPQQSSDDNAPHWAAPSSMYD
jgi:predicted esterase YcpF (UPF0227 family)